MLTNWNLYKNFIKQKQKQKNPPDIDVEILGWIRAMVSRPL